RWPPAPSGLHEDSVRAISPTFGSLPARRQRSPARWQRDLHREPRGNSVRRAGRAGAQAKRSPARKPPRSPWRGPARWRRRVKSLASLPRKGVRLALDAAVFVVQLREYLAINADVNPEIADGNHVKGVVGGQ